jgi:hypothetical protein
MERLLRDVRFAGRILWKDRGFAVTALLTLGICIGANAAIFAIVNSVLLRPLPVPEAAQLVHMYNAYPGAGVAGGSSGVTDYYDRLSDTTVFQEQALYNTRGVTLGGESAPQRVVAMASTPSLLRLLQVHPVRGRVFTEEEGEIGKTNTVILTYASWQQWFGGKDSAVGRDVRINGEPLTVVGVLPQGFSFLEPDVTLWIPVAFSAEEKSDDNRHSNNWSYVARLKPGATVEQARQQIDALNARNLDRFPNLKQILINAGFHTVVVPLQDYLVRDIRSTLYLLWGGVVFVLLVGGVNVTNLMLVRSSFEAMTIPLKRGRLFTASDDERAPKVLIIDERLAGRFWKNGDPVGRRMWKPDSADELTRGPGPKSRYYTVVGVVGNVRTTGLTEKEPVGAYYFPSAQNLGRGMTLVARTAGEPESLVSAIRQQVTAMDPELPFFAVKPMQLRVEESLVSRKTPMTLATLFGAIALFLAAVGIYGVLSCQVAQRRREIGIRMALGSDGRRIFGLIVSEGLWLLCLGIGAGLAGAFAIRRAMETQLFGVQPMDTVVLTVVIGVLGVVALLACAVPARRAARIDPLIALSEQ